MMGLALYRKVTPGIVQVTVKGSLQRWLELSVLTDEGRERRRS